MSFSNVASSSSPTQDNVFYTMRDLIDKNPLRFIEEFHQLAHDTKPKVFQHLMEEKVPMKDFVRCLRAIQNHHCPPERKKEYISNLLSFFSEEDLLRLIQSQLEKSTLDEFCQDLASIVHLQVATYYCKHLQHNKDLPQILTFLLQRSDQSSILIMNLFLSSKIEAVRNWVRSVYDNITLPQKACIILHLHSIVRKNYLQFETPETLSTIFVHMCNRNPRLDKSIALEFLNSFSDSETLSNFIKGINTPQAASILFPLICEYRLEDFLYNYEFFDNRLTHLDIAFKFLYQVQPIRTVMNAISLENSFLLCSTAPLMIKTSQMDFEPDLLPTFETIIQNIETILKNETDTLTFYQSALQQVPLILVVLAFASPVLKERIYTLFPYLTDGQMCAIAAIVPSSEMPQFLRETGNSFDQYYTALPSETLLRKMSELLANFKETLLLQMSNEIKEKYQKLKPIWDHLRQNPQADWKSYQQEYKILAGLRYKFINQLTTSLVHFARYERITRHLQYQHPFAPLKLQLEEYQKTFVIGTSPSFIDTSQLKPLVWTDDEDDS